MDLPGYPSKEETEGRYYDAEMQKEVKKLFQYIETGETGSPLTDRIEQRVSLVRQRGDIEMGYWSAYAALSDAKDEGLEEGRLSTLYELVKEKQLD